MPRIIHQRCFNHARRAAAARCPGCARFYCRECVTEHEGRVLCAECIEQRMVKARSRAGLRDALMRAFLMFIGFLTAWFFFYYIGQTLLALPDAFHDGTIWQTGWVGK